VLNLVYRFFVCTSDFSLQFELKIFVVFANQFNSVKKNNLAQNNSSLCEKVPSNSLELQTKRLLMPPQTITFGSALDKHVANTERNENFITLSAAFLNMLTAPADHFYAYFYFQRIGFSPHMVFSA